MYDKVIFIKIIIHLNIFHLMWSYINHILISLTCFSVLSVPDQGGVIKGNPVKYRSCTRSCKSINGFLIQKPLSVI